MTDRTEDLSSKRPGSSPVGEPISERAGQSDAEALGNDVRSGLTTPAAAEPPQEIAWAADEIVDVHELKSLSISLVVGCPSCTAQNPISEVVQSVECHRCSQKISLDWDRYAPHRAQLRELFYGPQRALRVGDLQVRLENSRPSDEQHLPFSEFLQSRWPQCTCGSPLDLRGTSLEVAVRAGAITCEACRASIPVKAATEFLRRKFCFEARYAVGPPIHQSGNRDAKTTHRCSNCSAPLTVKKGALVIQCEFCGADEDMSVVSARIGLPPFETFFLLLDAGTLASARDLEPSHAEEPAQAVVARRLKVALIWAIAIAALLAPTMVHLVLKGLLHR